MSGSAALAVPGLWGSADRTRGAVFLVGGYDGTANFGDVLQLEQAAKLVARLGESVVAIPVIDGQNAANSRAIEFNPLPGCDPHRPLVVGWPDGPDDLAPAVLPASVAWVATYLFGGGYFNDVWAGSRLAAVRAVDELAQRSGLPRPALVSSGIQVDAAWLRSLGGADLELVNRLATLGVRDPLPADAAPAGLSPAIMETADDTIAAFAALPARTASARAEGPPKLNLQAADNPWMFADPDAPVDYLVRFVDELAKAGEGRTTHVLPLVAFEDSRTTERGAYEAFISRPLDGRRQLLMERRLALGAVGLDRQAEALRDAALTVCCSYHTALFSLMAGVPAALLVETPHYEEKGAALKRSFGLPAELVLDVGGDPRAAARGVAALLESDRRGELDATLAGARERLITLRARAETEVLAQLACAYAGALGAYADEMAWTADADEDARGPDRLTALREDLAAALAARAEAEADTQRAETARRLAVDELRRERAEVERLRGELDGLLGSRSWRITAPLRGRRSSAPGPLRGPGEGA